MVGPPGSGILKLLQQVEENARRLAACVTPHDFRAPLKVGERWRCFKCGGEVVSSNALWYSRGLAHAAKKT